MERLELEAIQALLDSEYLQDDNSLPKSLTIVSKSALELLRVILMRERVKEIGKGRKEKWH